MTIHRPEVMNALNQAVLKELQISLQFLVDQKNPVVRGLVITGAGEKAFVAGADIKEMSGMSFDQAESFARQGQFVFSKIESAPFVVIAAVNGFALGGGFELALACDFILASDNAKFGLPEVALGLIPGFGGTVRLSRVIGLTQARHWIFSGEMRSALEAFEAGVALKVIPQAELSSLSEAQLQVISQRGPLAVAAAKKAILKNWALPVKEALEFEAHSFAILFRTADVQEGTQAFLNKRKPDFKGH